MCSLFVERVGTKSCFAERVVVDEDLDLWEALRACRQTLANEHNVPAYVIFHEMSSLLEIDCSLTGILCKCAAMRA